MDFRTWLITHHADEQSPIGDLARDVRSDTDWPTAVSDELAVYRDHLEAMDAVDEALEALDDAWDAYEAQRP
ncbi:YozE family protein [Streptomyces alfalfae]|uniref:YozE family protein n=1 Tax=Streptomyces alfalfae TaxID=1642299 RepID=UPI00281232FE|nr:YozE family protein [Streptomyces alfalfae]